MRLLRCLRHLVFLTFCGMIYLTFYIVIDFLPEFEKTYTNIRVPRDNGETTKRDMGPVMEPRKTPKNLSGKFVNGRERYKRLLDVPPPVIGRDWVVNWKQYFIYRCDSNRLNGCDDWADHVKGMETAYLIANLTGRVFKAEIQGFPCKLSDYVIPNKVSWTLPASFHEVLNPGIAGVGIQNVDDSHTFYNNLYYQTDFKDEVQENLEYIYFKSNLDFIPVFKNSTIYSKQLAWMQGLARDEIHVILYKRLFKLSWHLRKRLDLFLFSILPSPEHRLICLDLGLQNTSDPHQMSNIWSFFRTQAITSIHKIFINTISDTFITKAKSAGFKSQLVTLPHTIRDPSTSGAADGVCENLEKSLFTQQLLVNCDTLVVGTNDLGRLAAYMRETDDGLHCLMGNGHIHPCRADSFNELYQIHE